LHDVSARTRNPRTGSAEAIDEVEADRARASSADETMALIEELVGRATAVCAGHQLAVASTVTVILSKRSPQVPFLGFAKEKRR
jgi:hypothetical protein